MCQLLAPVTELWAGDKASRSSYTGCSHPSPWASVTPTKRPRPLPLRPSLAVCHCPLSLRCCHGGVRCGRGVAQIPRLQRLQLELELPHVRPVHDAFGTSVITPGPPRTTHSFRRPCVLAFVSNPLRAPHVPIDFLFMHATKVLANYSTPAAPLTSTSALRIVQRHSARPLPFLVSLHDD